MASVFKTDSACSESLVAKAAKSISGLAGFNLSDLADEGRRQLDHSQQESDQILASARAEAILIRKDAQQQGYKDGLAQAAVDAESRLQAAAIDRAQSGLDLVQSALDQIQSIHQSWMDQYAESLTATVLAATRRILSRELAYDPQLIVAWAKQAVQSTRSASHLTVAVHPETLALIGQSLDDMLSSPDLPEQTFVEPDESVGLTEIVVRQSGGEIHAGLQAQLQRLEELLA
ncbi:FliH/SctL family protein [Planctomycetes bacterium K23_9]|uniref:Flagellar assembly protein FliH n=1 Tax=Stieleria marina TaxID=1930275 RepID=A0A517NN44_9BACT|nr:flagellar assembly protein H [Planctomycetes bacterium K23_9]